jgi:hypothetical protein
MLIRSAFYVDGFNLYHAVADLGEPFLKWLNLWKLAQTLIPSRSEALVKVVFCTAYYPGSQDKRFRHEEYIAALKNCGVSVVMGHYVHEPRNCRSCGHEWRKPTEKETDINLALSLYEDAAENIYDKAYLLTADSDQAATARFFRRAFPEKELTTVSPPGRNFSVHITPLANGGKIALNRDHIEKSLLPPVVLGDGRAARRPREYEPPAGWFHPDKRPAR